MKKLCILLLPLLCSLLLASCDSEQHEHTYHYICTEEVHQRVYTCTCPSADIAELHADTNADGACDICGYGMIEAHQHTGSWQMSAESHCYQYTCGCDFPEIAGLHADANTDGACDVCGYGMSVVIPDQPLRSLAGCEWLAELYLEEIAEIKMISEEGMVASGCFKYISRSDNVHSIAHLHEDLIAITVTQVSEEKTQVCDGGTVTVFFTLKDGTVHRILLNNGQFYQDAHGNHFEISHLPAFRDGDEHINCYAFESVSGVGRILDLPIDSCEWEELCQFPLEELEFIQKPDDLALPDVIRDEYIITDFGTLHFVDAEYFYIAEREGNAYYRLVGKNLDELIEEYRGQFDE